MSSIGMRPSQRAAEGSVAQRLHDVRAGIAKVEMALFTTHVFPAIPARNAAEELQRLTKLCGELRQEITSGPTYFGDSTMVVTQETLTLFALQKANQFCKHMEGIPITGIHDAGRIAGCGWAVCHLLRELISHLFGLLEKQRGGTRLTTERPRTPEGSRHDRLTSLAAILMECRLDSSEIEQELLAENEEWNAPPLPEGEVKAIALRVRQLQQGGKR